MALQGWKSGGSVFTGPTNLSQAQPSASVTPVRSAVRTETWEARPWDTVASAQPDPPQLSNPVPNLQPISSSLARELQQEQRKKARLRKQLQRLERRLHDRSFGEQIDTESWPALPSGGPQSEDSDDPLYSSGTAPSVQQLQRMVVHRRAQLLHATSSSINDVIKITHQLQDLSSCLNLTLDLVVHLVARHEPLMLQPPHQLPPRLALLSAALQLPQQEAAELLSTSAPQLLGTRLVKLQSNLAQLSRVFSSRGINTAEVLQVRPDLLAQDPRSVEAKLEQLPGALGMSRQHVRQLVGQCPELLRRSVNTVSHRYRNLCQLFNIPDSFVEEFVVQEPELLCMSAATLKAKFESLLRRYGAFADDVVDMVLVDPDMLINADPAAAPPAPTVKASRKKQQKLLLEQQLQQQQQQQRQVQEPLEGHSSTAATWAVEEMGTADQAEDTTVAAAANGNSLLQWEAVAEAGDAVHGGEAAGAGAQHTHAQTSALTTQDVDAQQQQQQQQQQAAEEPWQTVLRLRLQRQQAARERQRQRRQQQQQDWLLLGGDAAKRQQMGSSSGGGGSNKQSSPVRRLLAFAAATGLSAEQALLLWQQEPSLSELPTAVVSGQMSGLAAALGLAEGSSTAGTNTATPWQWQQQQQQQSQRGGLTQPSSSYRSSSSNSIGNGGGDGLEPRPIQQVLVKEPALLALHPDQVSTNMQGLCDLLGLELLSTGPSSKPTGLLPLLWQQPGLLLLPPEVAEYRLQHLAGLLQLSVPRALQLVLQQPELLQERPVLLASRLGSLCTLLGVGRSVASECVLREPLLLCVDEEELQGRWETLVGRFGWAPDALDVVLADPAALMRDSLDES